MPMYFGNNWWRGNINYSGGPNSIDIFGIDVNSILELANNIMDLIYRGRQATQVDVNQPGIYNDPYRGETNGWNVGGVIISPIMALIGIVLLFLLLRRRR